MNIALNLNRIKTAELNIKESIIDKEVVIEDKTLDILTEGVNDIIGEKQYKGIIQRDITEMTIPETITSLRLYALNGCSKLSTLKIKAQTPPVFNSSAVPSTVSEILVPCGTMKTYKAATNWSSLASKIKDYEDGDRTYMGLEITADDVQASDTSTTIHVAEIYKVKDGFSKEIVEDLTEDFDIASDSFDLNKSTVDSIQRTITYKTASTTITQAAWKNSGYCIIDSSNSSPIIEHSFCDNLIPKRCLAKSTSDGVAICYLDENNSELFHDGTTAASLDGSMGLVMVDVPEYYYKGTTDGTKYTYTALTTEFDGSHQSRRVLIGAFEGTVKDSKLLSIITGSASTGSLTPVAFHTNAVANGTGWDIIDYDSHCKVAWLLYIQYGNLNSQALFGTGNNSASRIIGSTKSLGNKSGNDSVNTSLFGLENWWGDKYEWMGGLYEYNKVIYIFDGFLNSTSITGTPKAMGLVSSDSDYRTITPTTFNIGYISKMQLGEYGDLIPIEFSGDYNTYYSDYGYVASGSYVALRSNSHAYDSGGATYFFLDVSPGHFNSVDGSRLLYRGNITVIDNPLEFINL